MTVDAVGKGRYRHSFVMVMVAEGGRSMSIEMRVGDGDAPGRCGGFSFPIMILPNSQVSATYKSAGTDLGGGVSINVCPSVIETQLLVIIVSPDFLLPLLFIFQFGRSLPVLIPTYNFSEVVGETERSEEEKQRTGQR